MLKMEHVSFQYYSKKTKSSKPVIKDLSLDFEVGKLYTIYGESGIGKTTCLALLGGLEKPTEGKITLDGTDIAQIGYNTLRQKYVSYIFQNYYLFPYMNAVENVMMAMPSKKSEKNSNINTIHELLDKLSIPSEDRNRPVFQLSGGQQQRIAIARALSSGATYILADEPTGNLDEKNSDNIMHILRQLVDEGKCVIVVTHSERVKQMSDVCISLENR